MVLPILCYFGIKNDLKAVSAIPIDMIFYQPDGSTFIARLKGDEWFNWVETSHKEVIVKNKSNGYYEYAKIIKIDGMESLAPSGMAVQVKGQLHSSHSLQIEPISQTDLKRLAKQARKRRNQNSVNDAK